MRGWAEPFTAWPSHARLGRASQNEKLCLCVGAQRPGRGPGTLRSRSSCAAGRTTSAPRAGANEHAPVRALGNHGEQSWCFPAAFASRWSCREKINALEWSNFLPSSFGLIKGESGWLVERKLFLLYTACTMATLKVCAAPPPSHSILYGKSVLFCAAAKKLCCVHGGKSFPECCTNHHVKKL